MATQSNRLRSFSGAVFTALSLANRIYKVSFRLFRLWDISVLQACDWRCVERTRMVLR
jgi:hypothetical protein